VTANPSQVDGTGPAALLLPTNNTRSMLAQRKCMDLHNNFIFFQNFEEDENYCAKLMDKVTSIYSDSLASLHANGAEEGKLVIARTPHSALRCSGSLVDHLWSMKCDQHLAQRDTNQLSQTGLTGVFADEPVYAAVRLSADAFMFEC
jgi:hypothetical protein